MVKENVKKIINSNQYLKKAYPLIKDIRHSILRKETGMKKIYPEVLQMPITTKCNSRCVMCNIPNMDKENEMDSVQFGKALRNPLFKKIKAIGINGGEPFLLSNLEDYVKEAIESLPSLQGINIISNGFITDRILDKTKKIYDLCKKHNVKFYIMFSLDGYGEIHDIVRGIPGAFNKVIKTIETIYNDLSLYADGTELACTVVKQNVNNLVELDMYCKLKGYNIKYRLGIKNERIDNKLIFDNFSVFGDKDAKQTATEFFYSKYIETRDYNYYSIFRHLELGKKRGMGCDWKQKGITMDPKGNIYYCAVESKKICDIKNENLTEAFFSQENLNYRKEIIETKCDKCIHDYRGDMLLKDVVEFYKYRLDERQGLKKFIREL